jgi:hypothetical protein
MTIVTTVISIVALIIATIGTIIGVFALIKVEALSRSTHTVQLTPIDPEIDAHNQKLMKEWATKEEVIDKQRKMAKEEMEDKLEEFVEDEVEIISY